MIDLACLKGPPPPAGELLFSDGVFNIVGGMLVLAILLAALAAPLTRSRYRRRIVRLMGFDQIAPRPVAPASSGPRFGTRASSASLAVAPPRRDALAGLSAQRERRITRATVAAWLAFAAFGLVAAGVDPKVDLAGRVGYATALALLAIGPAVTNLPPRWARWAVVAGLVACAMGLALMLALRRAHPAAAPDDPLDWETAIYAAIGIAAYFAMFHRSLRGQVLPVFVLLTVCMLAVLAPYGLLERHAGACLVGIGNNGSPLSTAFLLLTVPVILLGLWLSFRALGGLVWLMEHGWVSELSLVSVFGLAVIATAAVMGQIPEHAGDAAFWSVWVPLPWLAVTLAVYALVLGQPPGAADGPQLLVLRVFSKDSRKRSLLDAVQARWRFVGAVHQIGGPDMVAMNVDPYESAMFLSNRTHELFLPVAGEIEHLQARLQTAPDREGRFSINEVFCFNTAWRRTVEQLMELSQVIVLDLRELTAQREGTGYEIARLAHAGLLQRVVAVGDGGTDWAHVEHLLRAEGQDPARLKRLDIAAGAGADGLFELLLGAATVSS